MFSLTRSPIPLFAAGEIGKKNVAAIKENKLLK
jgi:hypothetical protein